MAEISVAEVQAEIGLTKETKMFGWLFGRKKPRQSEGKSAQPPYGASMSPYVVPTMPLRGYTNASSSYRHDPMRSRTDDDGALTGSAITDGLLGIPSSPTALMVDIATHDFGSSSTSFDSSSSASFDSGSSSSFDSGSSGGGDSGGGGSGW